MFRMPFCVVFAMWAITIDWTKKPLLFLQNLQETNRINKNGELFLSSMKYRSQQKNLEDAIEKVEMIIKEASYIPKETTLEKKARVKKL